MPGGASALRLGPETEELYPFELSGGMARRVLIASAVTEKPRLIIADEPTAGPGCAGGEADPGTFPGAGGRGAGILFITHDLELALTVADEVTVFYEGETIEQAKAADFEKVENLRHPYTRALWHAMPEHGFRVTPDPEEGKGAVS